MGAPIGPTDALSTVISADSEVFSKGDMVPGLVTDGLGIVASEPPLPHL